MTSKFKAGYNQDSNNSVRVRANKEIDSDRDFLGRFTEVRDYLSGYSMRSKN